MDVENKLKINPELLGTKFIMINPELIAGASPTIPKGFPKSLIPNNLCQNEMAYLVKMMINKSFNNVDCESEQSMYFNCKQRRDSLLFKRIKEWEIQTIDELTDFERKIYLSSLDERKKNLLDTYEKTSILPKNKGFRQRLAVDIKQIEWRVNYINQAITNTYSV